MCGIAGFWGSGDRADLVAMTNALAHRGPDGEGFHCDVAQRVYLGHRRLAIRDLIGGHQPMWNEDGTVAVVYNGEIYNHAELRAELVSRGHRFATESSDTEVLVHGFEEWGRRSAASAQRNVRVCDLRSKAAAAVLGAGSLWGKAALLRA
jgi:asparagine synthase (glutamine-hydrolysing)